MNTDNRDTFIWTDELVNKFALRTKIEGTNKWVFEQLEQFKKEHTPKSSPKIPEWEILTCFDNEHHACKENIWHNYIPKTDETRISNCDDEMCLIRSVKRLSDGDVFSVGDRVNCDMCPESFSQQTIEKFIIADEGFMIASCAGVATSINNISKSSPKEQPVKPIKVEHFGVDLRENEYCYSLVMSTPIPEEKYDSIKSAIERELNGESWDEQFKKDHEKWLNDLFDKSFHRENIYDYIRCGKAVILYFR